MKLLRILADGRFHSGEALGQALGISRTMVWKHIQALQSFGIDCHSVSGKGYRLADGPELLDLQMIEAALEGNSRSALGGLELHPEIPSTNRHLMERLGTLRSGHACLAERQTAGRGRRGREWISPFARNIYLSLYWRFEMSPMLLSGLGLAICVAIVRTLRGCGIDSVGLKWPNDLLWQGRKLGGILLEMSGESGGPCHVVIGVGLNVEMRGNETVIDQPWVSLNEIAAEPLSRNLLAGRLLHHLLEAVQQFQAGGLELFMAEWQCADLYLGSTVAIHHGNQVIEGVARGVEANGALILEVNGEMRSFHSGEVSLRPRG